MILKIIHENVEGMKIEMKNIGIVSYNIHCNFTNYGSALQSYALSLAINKLGKKYGCEALLVNYCPDILKDKDPLNPIKNMWDKDAETIKMCELSMPFIRENYEKFNNFYNNRFHKTKNTYYSNNFNDIREENINRFVCGSDTIFCVDEFGIDDGYYANYDVMKNGYTISYAASFGDSHFNEDTYKLLNDRVKNFKALGIREKGMIPYLKKQTNVEIQNVCDPTLLLDKEDYKSITNPRIIKNKYLLLYSRRYNKNMEEFAEKLANENGWEIVEISLRATNASKHKMFYEAGVEDFLSLVNNAEFIVTNSYHGMIFSIQFAKEFIVFSREQCDTKIEELIKKAGCSDRMVVTGKEKYCSSINYDTVKENLKEFKEKSWDYLDRNIKKMCED